MLLHTALYKCNVIESENNLGMLSMNGDEFVTSVKSFFFFFFTEAILINMDKHNATLSASFKFTIFKKKRKTSKGTVIIQNELD